ncbi:PD-(D/E)XK nuclease family protein [uncultured Helicobacter sp.]|mgnify:CR=1 FL=1|uniref:RecB family exonuclease n=1 Tax=uncultured Helicobacter sp. TaxID=175537 RepID=UPI002611AE52|nr:PD-(D/E)XK nuclease family protein [uncultured Helicobacter sp.]
MEILYLFSSARSIKRFYAQNYAESFLPTAKSIGEFLEFILRVDNKRKIPKHLRQYYLYLAIQSTKTQKLGEFAKNFTQFLQNSSFFLKFYDELCAECVLIEDLKELDVYALYDDHLQVLESVFDTYKELLEKHNFFDHYFLQDYAITFELLKEFSEIQMQVDGFLSRFEVNIFREISKNIPFYFSIKIDIFNQDYYKKVFALSLDCGAYIIKLEQEKFSIADFKETCKGEKNLEILEFQDRIAEVGGVFSQIDIWLKQGVLPERINVILPDESFAEYLKLFDKARNFNFAMGQKLNVFRALQALIDSIPEEELQDFEGFEEIVMKSLENQNVSVYQITQEVLNEFKFSLPYLKELEVREQILMFLEILKEKTLDDVGGGRIRVMGILETRGVDLEYVIIPEFNADNVPSLSNKDLFLNTKIRESVGLPTRKNRENLQKHYYAEILSNAKETRILCLNNTTQKPSRFLLEDSIFGSKKPQKTSLAYSEYFLSGKPLIYEEKQIIAPLNVKSWSATSLECFLQCKRKFYYRYILGLKAQTQEHINMGSKIHKILQEVYAQGFRKDLYKEVCLRLEQSDSQRERFESELAKKYLKGVFDLEQERLQDGWNPISFESDFEFTFCEFIFKGRIDRIDEKNNEILILDYKYKRSLKIDSEKSYEKSTDFQLPIYYLAIKKQKPSCNVEVGFYDLYEAEIKKEKDLEAKIKALEGKLEAIKQEASEVEFSLTNKRDVCKYCDFIYLCNRY